MAAKSLTLTAITFHPTSSHERVAWVKCTPSTIVSVVKRYEPAGLRHAAASSPVSTRRALPGGAGVRWRRSRMRRVRRSMAPNSPTLEIFMVQGFMVQGL